MIKSMTAYSEASHNENFIQCNVEIRSYNSKNLDIALYMPRAFSKYEDGVKKLIAQKLSRGRIEIRITIEDQSDDAVQFEVDITRVRAYYKALIQLKEQLKSHCSFLSDIPIESGSIFESTITIDNILDGKEMIKPAEKNQDNDILIWETIAKSVDSALNNLEAMRKNEGENLSKDLLDRLNYIEIGLLRVEEEAALMPAIYRDRLMDRIKFLIGTSKDTVHADNVSDKKIEDFENLIDPVRLAQEVAILADKSDISEEIVRARSHISLFRDIIKSDDASGRKLNFLIQEFNREFNTMGSKSGRAELSHIVVDLKSELEKIREQIQNIE
ncbi:MAG: YicC family protein [Desulfamplus sp.]|nr:YicC family protein [Desulfamplus sp.]